MDISKKQLTEAILTMANTVGRGEVYSTLLKQTTLPELTKMIIYEMFLNEFLYYNCEDDLYSAYRLILNYCLELEQKGYVEFKNN